MSATSSLRLALVSVLAVTGTTAVQAGGFYLGERSIKASGRAFAGAAVEAADASVMSFNPAAITGLSGASLSAGGYLIMPKARVSDQGSSADIGPFSGIPVGGDSSDQGFSAQPSGYIAVAAPVTPDVWVGLSVTAPFGLKNDYEDDYFGRYDSTRSSVMVIDIAPTLAWRVAPGVSVGGSLSIQRASAKLDSAIPNPYDPAMPNPASDGAFKTEGKDWSIGYAVGLVFEPSKDVRIGASYRGGVKHRLTGTGTTELAGTEAVLDMAADLKLPDMFSLAVAYDATPRLTLLAQVNRYNWSRFKEILIELEDNSELASPQNSRDTWGGSVGADYDLNDRWTLRGGVEFDETPTVTSFRSTRLPDANRLWLALGTTVRITEQVDLDLSYAHMIRKTEKINRTTDFPLFLTTVATTAETRTSSNVLGLGLSARF